MLAACLDEAQALAFAAGELGDAARAPVEAHIDDCESCRRVLAALVRGGETREWRAGAHVGRYTVGARIGRGGMGAVWRAEDRELGRAVALKRVHGGGDGEHRARLVREARAAAQLQHPNVVAVYEVGEADGEPFLAMELVDGETLASWLRAPRSVRDIAGVLAQAGRGLAAAHAIGLVHRDLKPDNVLVDRTGRARVADFGLARAGDGHGSVARATGGLGKLTETGAISGTPAYMAPELVEGAPPDARSDQYAFAVTAFEALYGCHPFVGDSVEARWLEMAAGRIRDVRGKRRVPARLDRAVRRALAIDPEARWPSVAAFVAELERRPRRVWPWLAALGVLAAANAGAYAWTRGHGDDCERGASLVDDVWNATTRIGHARAFATAAPGRATEIATTDRLVDDWADAWRLGRRAACRAQPAERTARVACLDRALGDLRAQLATWEDPNREVVDRAIGAIAGLPRPGDCTSQSPPPSAVPKQLEDQVARIAAMSRTGREREAQPELAAMLAAAQATGDHETVARAFATAARVERALDDHEHAREHDARAAREAASAGDDTLTVDALLDEAANASDGAHPSDSLGLCDAADALIARGHVDREDRAATARADALAELGRAPEAIAAYSRAIAILEPRAIRDRSARLHLADALGALGTAYGLQERFEDARAALARSLAMEEPELGPDHPDIGRTLADLGRNELALEHGDDGTAHLLRARQIFAHAYGEHAELVTMADVMLADDARVHRRCGDAVPRYERARDAAPAGHQELAVIESGLANCARQANDDRGAIAHYERALAVYASTGKGGADLADVRNNYGMALLDVGRIADARAQAEQALTEYDDAGAEPEARVDSWRVLAEIEASAGHAARAIAFHEKIIAAIGDDKREQYAAVRKDSQAQIAELSRAKAK
ncbi:MAG TPA: protein kinase [Kofleriaceae bacterium]|nr:protein kinase [Kofleriaceae bacterium]